MILLKPTIQETTKKILEMLGEWIKLPKNNFLKNYLKKMNKLNG